MQHGEMHSTFDVIFRVQKSKLYCSKSRVPVSFKLFKTEGKPIIVIINLILLSKMLAGKSLVPNPISGEERGVVFESKIGNLD